MVATQSDGGAWQASELTLPGNAAPPATRSTERTRWRARAPGYCTVAGSPGHDGELPGAGGELGRRARGGNDRACGRARTVRPTARGCQRPAGRARGTWSLSAGSLPAGLSLNASTGVISGVPRAVGRSNFTVSVSDPGPPVQHASGALSIAVGPAPPAAVRLLKTSGSLITLTLSCRGSAGQTCSGTLKLSAREHLTGHRITAVTASTPKKKPKPKKTIRTVTLASATYTFTGTSRTLTITLGTTGKLLLATYHKLSAKLTLTPTGARTPATTKTLTFKAPPAKPKHR